MKCPCCHDETSVRLDNKLTGKRILDRIGNNQYCDKCEMNGLGKIYLDVIKFDWEKKLSTSRPEK